MGMVPKKGSIFYLSAFVFSFLYLFLCVERSGAQATTDPSEGRWRKNATTSPAWNISGEPCSGAAIDSTNFTNPNFNPGIKCDCSYNNGTTCHITQLKVAVLAVGGTIPEELQNLTYLNYLDLTWNNLTGPLPAFIGNLTELQSLHVGTNALSGTIPKELGKLQSLSSLALSQNYLTGPLPAFIGNMTELQSLSVGANALSGTIPKELGKLQNLSILGIGNNNFHGSLPSELGNLTNLQTLFVDSCGVGGEFPLTVSSLKKLQILLASDNNFTGKIPDFSETKLFQLRMQGNSFEGPIPSSFSSLTSLKDLWLGDISNGSSTLAFISNLTSLETLVLRNTRISDTIPPNFSRYTNLRILDLSFNNLTGHLPPSLFDLSSLQYLFLGNNSLSGSLPASISTSLLNIDLSYNQLSGSFPSWVTEQNLELNLVANNFVLDSSNNSVLPSGLNCLQQDIPCNRGSPIYSSFAITCGGYEPITSSDGTVYEIDSKSFKSASYYVTDQKKWAVSSVGIFVDNRSADFILRSTSQFSNTREPELYQTARMSPSSLRYYGLGLENGNYTIKLHFAETKFLDPPDWTSVGRRVFDIYIQGNLKEKDFDIRKEAGEKSFRAIVKEFTAPVTNNFLEIHFFWSGKGTGYMPPPAYYGPSISAISVYPFDFIPTVSNKPPSTDSTNKRTGLVVGIAAGAVALVLFTLLVMFIRRQRRRLGKDDDEDLFEISTRPNTFTYMELKSATDNFCPSNKLGEGGFGRVFKGKLSDGRTVAVKQLSVASRQGKLQFMTEIATVSAVQHRNLVKLCGCCIEGGNRLLVYEYLENKSLDQALFGKSNLHLDWPTRFEICLGTARGLAYLHEESRVRIVHRDIKASNILLDADLNPKISDFGLAKLYDDKKTHITTRVAGTIGYLAPEYAMRGHLTEKADVFGFGVVALEVVSGRPNSDRRLEEERVFLLEWAWNLRENGRELEMVDPSLSSFNQEEAIRIINVAFLCTQASPMLRPPMSRVVAMLAGDTEVGEVTTKPGYLTDWRFNQEQHMASCSDPMSAEVLSGGR
ncbi:probable LRR receptor-like serine/threonine-protein kinase At1g56140 isoform X2 [Elaeis guineensis]|uniref:probable LRR receptor-like serine/threonine-protein kinase At1g56140 isoform X2 n=1 Tax=Elaeis guineensis var. tenera TaxID=51953 RepID=UPI003C6CD068